MHNIPVKESTHHTFLAIYLELVYILTICSMLSKENYYFLTLRESKIIRTI